LYNGFVIEGQQNISLVNNPTVNSPSERGCGNGNMQRNKKHDMTVGRTLAVPHITLRTLC
jgi:hypothetical protein